MKTQEKDTFEKVTDVICYGICPVIGIVVIAIIIQIGKLMVL